MHRSCVWVASSFFVLTSLCHAQFSSGFQGTITDRTGGVVPGVIVRITNTATGVQREVLTSESGVFVATTLNPGTYSLEATKEGFVTAKQDNLVLEANLTRKVDFSLELGNVRDVVNVSGQATVLETETAHIVTQMNNATISELPVINN